MAFEKDSKEQAEIRQSVKKLAEREIPKYQNERFFGTLPRTLFQDFAAMGLSGLSVSEEFDGISATPTTFALVIEEIAAVDSGCAIFLAVHNMVAAIIQRVGNTAQKGRYLSKMAKGELLGAFALTEPSAGSDASALRTELKLNGDSIILNGDKCYITSAGWADLYLVFARAPGSKGKEGISTVVVPADAAGLTISPPEKKMGAELSPIASLNFNNCMVPAANLLGEIGSGYKAALSGLAGGRVSIACCANGISRSAIEKARAHLCEREQFGQKLKDFQGLQFILADMQIKYHASAALVWEAAKILEGDPNDSRARTYASMAKCFATDSCMQITTDAVQLLGGAGYIREYQVERMMRDAKMLQIVEGTNQIQRILIARELLA